MCAAILAGIIALSPHDQALLPLIHAIQTELAEGEALIRRGERLSSRGFLISNYSLEELALFLGPTQRGWVAKNTDDAVIGYLLSSPGSLFAPHHPTTQIVWESSAGGQRCRESFERADFTYLDQIGVARAHERRGIGRQMHHEFLKTVTTPLVVSAVLEEPVRNEASYQFFLNAGYAPAGYFFTPQLRGIPNVKSTLFCKEVGTSDKP